MARAPKIDWSSVGDLPIDSGQRDAMLLAHVRSAERGARWDAPEGWPGAWIRPGGARPEGAEPEGGEPDGDEAEGEATRVWLDGLGSWLSGAPGWASPSESRRPPGGSGAILGLGVADQTSLWRHRTPLAHADGGDDADVLAGRRGPRLADLAGVPDAAGSLGWVTADMPGWVAGGELHLPCPEHDGPLAQWRCDHARAVGRKRRFLVGCGECSAEDIAGLGKRLGPLLRARAALDAELPEEPGATARHHVYVIDVITTDESPALYVGQTSGDVVARLEQHRSGGAGAARTFRAGASVGDLRDDLMPAVWVLPTRSAALAAEAFLHRWLEVRFPDAVVHGDVSLLG